jgi:hypothetical protein
MGRWRNMGRGRASRSACSAAYVQSSARVMNARSASPVSASVAHLMHCAANSRYSRAVCMKNLPEFCNAGNFAQRGLSQIDQSVAVGGNCGNGGGIKILLVDRATDLHGRRRRARLWTTPTDWAAEPLPFPPRLRLLRLEQPAAAERAAMSEHRRFPPPWSVEERDAEPSATEQAACLRLLRGWCWEGAWRPSCSLATRSGASPPSQAAQISCDAPRVLM